MSNQGTGPPGPNEMLDLWRQTAADLEQRWNDYLNQMMGTDAFAQLMARSMDSYVTLQSTFTRGVEQYLRALNLPSRADIAELGDRIAALERRIDALAETLAPSGQAEAAPSRRERRKPATAAKPKAANGRSA